MNAGSQDVNVYPQWFASDVMMHFTDRKGLKEHWLTGRDEVVQYGFHRVGEHVGPRSSSPFLMLNVAQLTERRIGVIYWQSEGFHFGKCYQMFAFNNDNKVSGIDILCETSPIKDYPNTTAV